MAKMTPTTTYRYAHRGHTITEYLAGVEVEVSDEVFQAAKRAGVVAETKAKPAPKNKMARLPQNKQAGAE